MIDPTGGILRTVRLTLGMILAGAVWAEEFWNWEEGDRYRRAPLPGSNGGPDGFAEQPVRLSGITFVNRLRDQTSLTNQIYLNGSGVAAGDIDQDGLCDLYFCGLESGNQLYRNLGDWRFQNVTTESGTACADQASTGAAFADVDGDRDLDLLVNGIRHGTRLFLNDGHGTFQERTELWGLTDRSGSTSLCLADVDRNGWLDLYVVNYRNKTMRDDPEAQFNVRIEQGRPELLSYNGRPATSPDLIGRFSFDDRDGFLENGQADRLYLNDGNDRFSAVSWSAGVFRDASGQPAPPPYDWGLSAMFRDLNDDGWPDLYVCNDFQSPDRIWINDGTGRFRPIAEEAIRQTSLFSMGIDVADIDRDDRFDWFVVDMLSRRHTDRQVQIFDETAFAQYRNHQGPRPQYPRNTLFLNRGEGRYSEIARLSGVAASDWSWCPAFLDVDLDGYEDLLITTGHWRDAQNADVSRQIDDLIRRESPSAIERLRLRSRFPKLATPNVAFRNRRDLTFEESGAAWGFDSRNVSHGLALADLDNDGDQDVIVNCLNEPPLLLRNRSARPRLRVQLKGLAPNTHGIGAKISLRSASLPDQSQEMIAGGRYLSSDQPIRVFASAPEATATLTVRWNGGKRSEIRRVQAGYLYEIYEPVDSSPATPLPAAPSPLFQDDTPRLGHRHTDEPFDDDLLQTLLPHHLSAAGPGATWFDFNRDGWEDLIIGAGRNGTLSVYRNDTAGRFVRQKSRLFATPAANDHGTILGWRPHDRETLLLIGNTNYESPRPESSAIRQVSVRTGDQRHDLLLSDAGYGALALADIDGDLDLDLFAGGHSRSGRYPEPPSSVLLINQDGKLIRDETASEPFRELGMIRGTIFADLTGDRLPELVLAGEWMPLRLFRNYGGRFEPWDPPVAVGPAGERPLSQLTGWWNSVSAGDFDGDGRLDLVAGNRGRNYLGNERTNDDRRIYFESNRNAGQGLIEAYFSPQLNDWAPLRDRLALEKAFPVLIDRYPSFASFGRASLKSILAANLPPMTYLEATTFESMIFLNREDRFEGRSLPLPAQFAPVFGLDTADFDLDGHVDVVLTQNFWPVATLNGRQDAGSALLLRGDGTGSFHPLPPQSSGLFSLGQGRGLAVCDYDHDGRPDLAMTQNGGPTRLWRNRSRRTGVRIRLNGAETNPAAIGARIRLVLAEERLGPVHEIRLGNGYWSQSSPILTMAAPGAPAGLRIRWPDGRTETVPLPLGTTEITRDYPGP